MKNNSSIPEDILKIQKKLATYEIGSRNYRKYQKILAKHVKKFTMNKRVNSNIKTIENIKSFEKISLNN